MESGLFNQGDGLLKITSERELLEAAIGDNTVIVRCNSCYQRFDDHNTFSKDGWISTQVTGFCEKCHNDEVFNA